MRPSAPPPGVGVGFKSVRGTRTSTFSEQRVTLSRSATVAKFTDHMLRRWDGFASFLGDGRACLSNNAAERAFRGFALGRKA
jgi:hypothetical protein